MSLEDVSILHWVPGEKHHCGYCVSDNSISNGLWAETLTTEDYQNMIDRGWRRSGKYCYKPIMNETCCPQYTIRCAVLNFKPSKSQKKVLKKFNKYLREGNNTAECSETNKMNLYDGDCSSSNKEEFVMPQSVKEIGNKTLLQTNSASAIPKECMGDVGTSSSKGNSTQSLTKIIDNGHIPVKEVKKGLGADLTLPKCQKAKIIRQQRREAKLVQNGEKVPMKPKLNNGKSLSDLINEESMNNVHNIKVKLVRPHGTDWQQYRKVEFELYKKYQVCIHKDPIDKCSQKSFERFLVDSPLQSTDPSFGSFHQQYWLDDKLIAVGVIDILPKCVSSVYFFYDPEYNHLTLGTYSALREVDFTRRLHERHPSVEYYYMGFYIHTCPKMRYKSKFYPSDLQCPETYVWTSIDKCLPLLEVHKYSRFQPAGVCDEELCTPGPLLNNLKIIVDCRLCLAQQFANKPTFAETFTSLGQLLGKKLVSTVYIVF